MSMVAWLPWTGRQRIIEGRMPKYASPSFFRAVLILDNERQFTVLDLPRRCLAAGDRKARLSLKVLRLDPDRRSLGLLLIFSFKFATVIPRI